MKKINILFVAAILAGCTGTQLKVTPDIPAKGVRSILPSVGIEDRSIGVPAQAGDLADAFAKELRNSRVAADVYYPQRPNDPIDTTLETKFTLTVDPHQGSSFAKSFFTGFTFFLLEPAFWYDFDYALQGEVDVLKDGKRIKHSEGKADATISAKLFSLGELPKLEQEALTQGKKVVFGQMINGITK